MVKTAALKENDLKEQESALQKEMQALKQYHEALELKTQSDEILQKEGKGSVNAHFAEVLMKSVTAESEFLSRGGHSGPFNNADPKCLPKV